MPATLKIAKQGHYLCSGLLGKPTKCKEDIIRLCFKGKYVDTSIEVRPDEAMDIITVLSGALSEILYEPNKPISERH